MPSLAAFNRRIGELLEIPLTLDDSRTLTPPRLSFTREAKIAWIAFHDEVEREIAPGGDLADARDAASKAADNAARLAALLHVFEHGPQGQISESHVLAATQIVTWHLYQFRRYFCELAPTPEMVNAQKLEAWLIRRRQETGEIHTKTQVILNQGPGGTRHRKELDEALMVLVRAGRARVTKENRTELVELNPALLEAA